MLHTFQEGVQVVRTRPVLINILTIGLIYGLYSEGFDRLWNKHILDNFTFPAIGDLQPVVWIGLLRASGLLLSVGASEAALRRINTQSTAAIGRSMLAIHALLFAGLVSFALAGQLIWIILAYWAISIARNLIGPLYTAWVNQDLEARVRATVISMSSQVDALGQIAGGPVVGLIGSAVSVRAAILTSASTLLLALPFYARARRYSAQAALPGSSTATESYDANPGREPTD
jgi:DHA3 family tetracycline resistance protein-like MFS transporter